MGALSPRGRGFQTGTSLAVRLASNGESVTPVAGQRKVLLVPWCIPFSVTTHQPSS